MFNIVVIYKENKFSITKLLKKKLDTIDEVCNHSNQHLTIFCIPPSEILSVLQSSKIQRKDLAEDCDIRRYFIDKNLIPLIQNYKTFGHYLNACNRLMQIFDSSLHNNSLILVPKTERLFQQIWDKADLVDDNIHLEFSVGDQDFFILYSFRSKIAETINIANQIAQSNISVIVSGETGVGKEWLANYIHYTSSRQSAPFQAINCSALAENLLEDALFGHEKGAFTGANEQKIGFFETVNKGTLFLDEVTYMSSKMQNSLLRVLENHSIMRLGGSKNIPVDVRIIVASNQEILKAVENGKFREDLYHRLNGIEVYLPPLRERKEDILLLSKHFLNLFNEEYKKECILSQEAEELIQNYNWPGNIREMRKCLERSVLMAQHNMLGCNDILLKKDEKKVIPYKKNMFVFCSEAPSHHVLKTIQKLVLEKNINYVVSPYHGKLWINQVGNQITPDDIIFVLLTRSYLECIQTKNEYLEEVSWIIEQQNSKRFPSKLLIMLYSGDDEQLGILSNRHIIDVRDSIKNNPNDLEKIIRDEIESTNTTQENTNILLLANSRDVSKVSTDDIGKSLIQAAKKNFESIAVLYQNSLLAGNAMQANNAVILLKDLNDVWKSKYRGIPTQWIDIGCGTGLVFSIVSGRKFERHYNWLQEIESKGAIDYSNSMLQIFRRNHPHIPTHEINITETSAIDKYVGTGSVDILTANNLLHWLYTEDMIECGIRTCWKMLKQAGLLAVSIAAVGTAYDFLSVYRSVIEKHLENRENGRYIQQLLENPIGLQSLDSMVRLYKRIGFNIEKAYLSYEPREFDRPDIYVDDVMAYGKIIFMEALHNKSEQEKTDIWQEIKETFRKEYYRKYNLHRKYIHDQYMLYIIASKPF